MLHRSIVACLAAALCGLVAACGGSSAGPGTGDSASLTPGQWATMAHGGSAPGSGLPAFPDEGSLGRSVSALGGNPVLGSEYLLMGNCALEGTGLRINAADLGNAGGTGGGGFGDARIGWALYGIGGLSGKRATSLNVECLPSSLGEEYYVGVADFTHLNWEWSGPVSIPEYQFDLSGSNARYISALGNLYFVVVCWEDNTALHSQSTVVVGDGNGSLPGAPRNLEASKGVFPDGVMLTWSAGAGAAFYVVQRASQFRSQGDPGGGDGSNGGGGVPGDDGWVTIGESQETGYFDATVPPNEICDYRVRSVNSAGVSAWSNVDYGYAGVNEPPFGDYALQGFVYSNCDQGGCVLLPLPGVTVTVENADGTVAASAVTDQDGYYFVEDLPQGAYEAVAGLDGYSFDPEYAWFELGPDWPGAWVDFYAYSGGGGDPGTEMGVYGCVYSVDESDPNGNLTPIAGATVTVSGNGAVAATATTDEQGFYQFLSLEPGVYSIQAEQDGYYFEDSYTFQWGENVPDIRFDFYGRLAP